MGKRKKNNGGTALIAPSTRWIGFVANRLVSRGRGVPVLPVLGIAVGVLALTVVIAVMNGFQLGFIESILEISSYHVRLDLAAEGGTAINTKPEELAAKVREVPGVRSAVPFREIQGIVRGGFGQQGILIRGLPPSAAKDDAGMAEKLDFESGFFDIEESDSILLGAELARRLRVQKGDTLTVISVSAIGPDETENTTFTVKGIFRSGFYEYDLGWAFINFDRAGEMEGEAYTLGLKLADRWQDSRILPAVQKLSDARVSSWREYNQAFFGALRTEKLFMFVLVGLIFIVVGLNIYQAQRRSVLERREEIGLLRAVGAGDRAVRLVFVWDGFLVGVLGASAGMALGLLISHNISAFFSLLETVVNGVLYAVSSVSSILSGKAAPEGGFAFFSPAVFYVKEIQGRVIFHEEVIIFLFGLFSALGAAWFASGKVSRVRPAEVLRYE
ncbi:MAG: ABC transporter permease [Treponema sp.]|nr:ABC transporter permease [Treponema sp.]